MYENEILLRSKIKIKEENISVKDAAKVFEMLLISLSLHIL